MKDLEKIAAQFLNLNPNCIFQKYVTIENKNHNLGLQRKFHKEIAEECLRQNKIQKKRAICNNPVPSIREEIKERVQKRLSEKLEEVWEFREGANGNTFLVEFSKDIGMYTERKYEGQYSSSCSYPKYSYTFILKMPFNHTFLIDKKRLLIIPKNFDFHKSRNNYSAFSWYQQDRGIGLRKVDGYLKKGKIIDPNKMSKSRKRKVTCEVLIQNMNTLEVA